MLHLFTMFGRHYAVDVESMSLFETDGVIFDVLTRIQEDGVGAAELTPAYYDGILHALPKHSPEAVREAADDIRMLVEGGFLFCAAAQETPVKDEHVKSLCLHVCHDCNLTCDYCFASQGSYHGEREYMSFDVGKSAIDFLIASSGSRRNLEVDFFGGEPLLSLDTIKAIVKYARSKEAASGKLFKFTLTTNGLLLDGRVSAYLNDVMDNVVLSLDGRRATHDRVRKTRTGSGSFDLILKNFNYFREIRGRKSYYLRGTYTALNTDFSRDVLEMCDLGFDNISVEPVVLPPEHPLALREEHLPALFEEYETLTKEYLERRAKGRGFHFFHFNVDLNGGPCLRRRLTGCGAGGEYLAVAPDGGLYPCHQFTGYKEYLLGSLSEGIKNTALREKMTSVTVFTKEECKNCWAKYLCSGGCTANAVFLGGGLNNTYAVGCALMKKRLECALHIRAQENPLFE